MQTVFLETVCDYQLKIASKINQNVFTTANLQSGISFNNVNNYFDLFSTSLFMSKALLNSILLKSAFFAILSRFSSITSCLNKISVSSLVFLCFFVCTDRTDSTRNERPICQLIS